MAQLAKTEVVANALLDENSADGADFLQSVDSGGIKPLALVLPSNAQLVKRGEEQRKQTQVENVIPSLHASLPLTSPLTQRIIERVKKLCNDERAARRLVLQVSPSTLSRITRCCLLVAYFDSCPYSRATEDGLVALAYRMYRRNLARKDSAPGLAIAMYDVKAEGNRSFAVDQLKASPVPKLFLFDPQRRAIVVWQGEPMSEVRPNPQSGGGEWTRTLPVQAILDALEHCMPITR